MNVKPGDMAKIVAPAPAHTHGAVVEVLGAATAEEIAEIAKLDAGYSLHFVWICKVFQGLRARDQDGARSYYLPGSTVWIPDAWLRRIEGDGERQETSTTAPERREAVQA